MKRCFFEIAYDGTNYHGWQIQPNAVSVQEVVEEALSTILREKTQIVASGRTDTGVHCEQQFFHADIPDSQNPAQLKTRLNSFLPADISIQTVRDVAPEAHARFDATRRAYRYQISTTKNPFRQGYYYFHLKPLNVQTMNAAAALLLGDQDFQAFSKVKTEVNHYHCEVFHAEWIESGSELTFQIEANRFLRGMVRAIVGTLLNVGKGKSSIEDVKAIIQSKDRRKAGAAAPPQGLFLTKVQYPDTIYK